MVLFRPRPREVIWWSSRSAAQNVRKNEVSRWRDSPARGFNAVNHTCQIILSTSVWGCLTLLSLRVNFASPWLPAASQAFLTSAWHLPVVCHVFHVLPCVPGTPECLTCSSPHPKCADLKTKLRSGVPAAVVFLSSYCTATLVCCSFEVGAFLSVIHKAELSKAAKISYGLNFTSIAWLSSNTCSYCLFLWKKELMTSATAACFSSDWAIAGLNVCLSCDGTCSSQ